MSRGGRLKREGWMLIHVEGQFSREAENSSNALACKVFFFLFSSNLFAQALNFKKSDYLNSINYANTYIFIYIHTHWDYL